VRATCNHGSGGPSGARFLPAASSSLRFAPPCQSRLAATPGRRPVAMYHRSMPSHGSREVRSVAPIAGGRVRVRFVLDCGCELERELADDRLIETPDGLLLVGKYPCPERHPVTPPRAL
jgi:hypothetical protein